MELGLIIIIVGLIFGLSLLTFLRKWNDSFVIIAFSIGFLVNSNLFTPFTSTNYGIDVGPMIFSIDSVLYTLFLYCICIKALHYQLKDVKLVIYSSIVAIIISAFIEFFANLTLPQTVPLELAKRLAEYIFSAIGSLLACWYMVWCIRAMKKKNISNFLILPAAMIGGAIINSTVYYCLTAILYSNFGSNKGIEYFTKTLYGSWTAKIIASLFSLLCYFINVKWWVPNEIKAMEKEKEA